MANDEKYPLALPIGTVLAGQYIIEEVLGQGGFGITYRASDHKSGQKVAVKEFFPDSMATRTQTTVTAFSGERGESFAYGKGCFLQEAETLAEFIGNRNIVRVHSYFEENGTAYFVMDFVEGISFDHYIKEHGGRVSYEEAEKILVPVMDALAAVHSRGIVHRDVTPDNIYITKDGTVKLLDFGAARYSLGDKSRSLDVVLKHGFAPKEQYTRHGKQGPFTDVYTLGASFYFAITGRRPPDSIDRMDEDELIPPSSLGAEIAPKKEDAILTAMNVQPQSRFQSMTAFKNALLGDGEAGPAPSQIPQSQIPQSQIPQSQIPQSQVLQQQTQYVQQSPAPKKKWKLWAAIAGGAVAAVALIAGVAIAVSSSRGSREAANYENIPEVSEKVETVYDSYTNENVWFTIEYPQGYAVSEPADTNVLFLDGKSTDFQVSVEYNYYTANESAVYSADDFNVQAEASDYQVIRDWVGTDCDVTSAEELYDAMGGRRCYCYSVSFLMDGGEYSGQLYVCDSNGDFGCYTILWVVNGLSEKAALYREQCLAMVDSFRLTGKYEPEGLTAYNYSDVDGADVSFMLGEELTGKIENKISYIYIYPVDRIYVDANMDIDPGYSCSDPQSAIESLNSYYFKYRDNTKYTADPTPITYGRYTYTVAKMEYKYDGTHFTRWVAVFPYGDIYWQISADATDEYLDTVTTAFSNLLFSLKIDDGDSFNENAITETSASTPSRTSPSGTGDALK